jgi:hypothetical protein
MRFGPFGKRRRPRQIQDKLDDLTIKDKEERLEDRRLARQLVVQAVQAGRPDLFAAAAILRPGANARTMLPPLSDTREARIVDALLARALADPDEQIDQLQERALRRRRLLRELDDDEDDEPNSVIKQMLPLLPLALVALNPNAAQTIGPLLANMLAAQQPAPPPPAPTVQEVQPVASPSPAVAPPQPVASLVEPTVQPASAGQSAPGPAPSLPEQEPTGSPNVIAFRVRPEQVLHNLQTLSPEDLADWVLRQPGGVQFAEQLDQIDEEQLRQYAAMPHIGPLAQWGGVIAWLNEHPKEALAVKTALGRAYAEEQAAI